MVFSGFGVNYMVRSNLNIVLVTMVETKWSGNVTSSGSSCGIVNNTLSSTTVLSIEQVSYLQGGLLIVNNRHCLV